MDRGTVTWNVSFDPAFMNGLVGLVIPENIAVP